MKKHLAVMNKEVIESILTGSKTVESRFSQKRISPFGEVSPGDTVYMKPQGGAIIGQFKVGKVISYQGLDKADIAKIIKDYGQMIGPWKIEDGVKFATLIFIAESERFITPPITIQKRDRRGWMVL